MPAPWMARTARMVERLPLGAATLTVARLVRGDSILTRTGWWRSAVTHRAVDAAGLPLPWYTYGAIAFLAERVRATHRVFEYGSGHSTLWWAARAGAVTSVENDREWLAELAPRLPANARVIEQSLAPTGAYAERIRTAGGPFDIVVNDGRQRVRAARALLDVIAEDGVVIWDNSDRARYAGGYQILRDAGFKRLDFHGSGPINTDPWCTSVFYRRDNVLGI